MSGLLLSLLGGTFKDWVGSRSKIAEKRADARASAVANGIPGWSDEWLVIVWSFPFVACYLPGGGEYATAALAHIDGLPEWYVHGFMVITSAVFGLDKIIKWRSGNG